MTQRAQHQNQDGRGLSHRLWGGFPVDEILTHRDFNTGYGVYPDLTCWNKAPTADDALTAQFGSDGSQLYVDASSTIANLTGTVGGGIRIFATADNEEAWYQSGGLTGAPFVITDTAASMRDMIFECAFRIPNITTAKYGFFIGLGEEGMAVANTIADGGTLVDKDLIGIFKPEGNTSGLDLVYNLSGGGGVVEHKADWQTLVANTWYHFGLKFDAINGIVVPWWGTGDRTTTVMAADMTNKITAADIASAGTDKFPDGEEMSPLIGLKNAHADDAYVDVRLLACAQLAPDAD